MSKWYIIISQGKFKTNEILEKIELYNFKSQNKILSLSLCGEYKKIYLLEFKEELDKLNLEYNVYLKVLGELELVDPKNYLDFTKSTKIIEEGDYVKIITNPFTNYRGIVRKKIDENNYSIELIENSLSLTISMPVNSFILDEK